MISEMAGRVWNPLEDGLLSMLVGDYLDCVEGGRPTHDGGHHPPTPVWILDCINGARG